MMREKYFLGSKGMANGDGPGTVNMVVGLILKATIPILVIGTVQAFRQIDQNGTTIASLRDQVNRVEQYGSQLSQGHDKTNIEFQSNLHHLKQSVDEMKSIQKEMREEDMKNRLLLERIATKIGAEHNSP